MKIHVFPFSAREGTAAADFPDQVPPQVRKQRVQRLSILERDLAKEYYQSLIGQDLEVLVERESETNPGIVRGTDRRYVPVEIPGTRADIGEFVAARGERATRQFLQAGRGD